MKKLVSIIAILLAAVSCVQENLPEQVDGAAPYTFTADFGSADVKATLEPGVTSSKVKWTEGDEVVVFADENKHKYVAESTAYSTNLTFEAMSQGETPTSASGYFALYPFDNQAILTEGGVISATLPSLQIAEEGNFSHHLAVAKAAGNSFSFRNVCGLVRVNIKTDDITSVVFEGRNDEVVSGGINITVNNEPTWEPDGVKGVKSVTLQPQAPSTTIAPGVYYFAVLPQTFEKGFQITAHRTAGDPVVKTAQYGITVARGQMVGGTIDALRGTGTEADPYILTSAQDMCQMNSLLQGDATTYFKLGYDIDMSPINSWNPVNDDASCQIHFDGNGKTIRNFNSRDVQNSSLFGVLSGTVKNLTIENASVLSNSENCGIIAGLLGSEDNSTLLENVNVSGSVNGTTYVGGFCGQTNGVTFKNCTADVTISVTGTDAGGFVGLMNGSTLDFENCSATLNLSSSRSGNCRYGGLVGYLKSGAMCVIRGTSTHGTISVTGNGSVAKTISGIVAYVGIPTRVHQSWTDLDINASNANFNGGVCGILASQLEIRNCYSSGNINGLQAIAGLVGINESGTLEIANSYSSSSISANRGVGGLVGIGKSTYPLTITKSVAWNPSVCASRTTSTNYSSAAVVGCASGINTFTDCYRRSDMNYEDNFRTLAEHENLSSEIMPLPGGVTDVNQSAFDGKSTSAATLSSLAQTLGWSDQMWNFSSTMPILHPYVPEGGGDSPEDDIPDDEPSTITPPEGWTTNLISSGMAHHSLVGWDDLTAAYQVIHVLEVDLNNPRYTIRFSVQPGENGRSTTQACQVFNDAVAAVNATYERGSVYIKSEGVVASAIPNDEISNTGVPNWKSEAGIFLDADGNISIQYPGRTSLSLDYLRTYYGAQACPNIFSSAPMLIDDYETVGEYFVPEVELPNLNLYKGEHPYRHQGVRHPRTAAALTNDNHLLLVTIDGRKSGVAAGMNAKEVTLFLKKHFNPQYAINMDGGGSTAMSIKGELVNDQNSNNNGEGQRPVPTHFLIFDNKQ